MAIQTNGSLYNKLQKAAPNARATIIIDGKEHEIQRVLFKSVSMVVEIHASAMSDAELFADIDDDEAMGDDDDDPDPRFVRITHYCPQCNTPMGGITDSGDLAIDMECTNCHHKPDPIELLGQPFTRGAR